MCHTKFRYTVPNDNNRAEDGVALRRRFEEETSIKLPYLGECCVFEFMIGVAIRMNETMYDHENPDQVSDWFWEIMENVGLHLCTDEDIYEYGVVDCVTLMDVLMDRKYSKDGFGGGLFPIDLSHTDQRDVEVWYQMMEYLSKHK